MLHYTINTGHTRKSPRSEVCQEAVQALWPIAEREGRIPGPGFTHFELTVTNFEGGALFTIWQGLPIVNCAVAWTKEGEEKLWHQIEGIYRDVYDGLPGLKTAVKPVEAPWLSVVLLPSITDVSKESVSLLGDLERCIAWTIVEMANDPANKRYVAKLVKQKGEVLVIQPQNGKTFTLAELRGHVGGSIEVIKPPGSTGAIMVVNANAKSERGASMNNIATIMWQEACGRGSPRSGDQIFGDAVLCHTSQLN